MTFRTLMGALLLGLVVSAFSSAIETTTITDQLGRTVTVPRNPARVIALAPSITEIIYALNQQQRLVGVTRYSDYPPEAQALPQVGSYVQLNLEKIAALKPDLCIAVKDGNPLKVIRRMEALNIPVYAVDPRDFDAIGTTITEIGSLLDATRRAGEINAEMAARIAQVQSRIGGIKTRPRVFFQIGVSPIVAPGTNTFIHELIEMAGGVNATAGHIPYPRVSREQVLTLAPEVVIITSMARLETFEKVKQEWQRWTKLPAVRKGRIHLVNSDLYDRASPRLVEGLEQLAELIHPRTEKGDS